MEPKHPPCTRSAGPNWRAASPTPCLTFAPRPPPCRHRSLALDCRRWAELVNSGQLLRSIDIGITGWSAEDTVTQTRFMQRVLSFCDWLAAHAAAGAANQPACGIGHGLPH